MKIEKNPKIIHSVPKKWDFFVASLIPNVQIYFSFTQFCSDFQSETSYERTKDVVMHINYNNEVTSLKIN